MVWESYNGPSLRLFVLLGLFFLASPILSKIIDGNLGCTSELDCQLNGKCVESTCVCDPGWKGPHCSSLKEGKSWVIWPREEAQPEAAAWGASIIQDHTGTYHMFTTNVFQKQKDGPYITCYHTQGTQLVHSTSKSITGPYAYSDIAMGPETNNPHIVRTSKGEYLLYHLNDNVVQPPIPACTGSGVNGGCQSSPGKGSTTPCGAPGAGTIGVAVSDSPYGPWKTVYPMCDIGEKFEVISNPSAWLMANNSVVVAFRYSNGHIYKQEEAIAIAYADSYVGPYKILNPDISGYLIEDPFIYKNSRGFHIFMHEFNCTCPYGDPNMIPGAHAYSYDAREWHSSPYPLYTTAITWANGTKIALNYRERPELLMDKSGNPAWLVTGAEVGLKYRYPTKGGPCQSVSIITEILY